MRNSGDGGRGKAGRRRADFSGRDCRADADFELKSKNSMY
jgi:hypothetical protein